MALGDGGARELAAEFGASEVLERVLGVVAGPNWDPDVVTADLDELDRVFRDHGFDGGLTEGFRSFRSLPDTGPHGFVEVWMCPAARCSRVDVAGGENPSPMCAILQGPCTLRKLAK